MRSKGSKRGSDILKLLQAILTRRHLCFQDEESEIMIHP
jgi:hypothetical protein